MLCGKDFSIRLAACTAMLCASLATPARAAILPQAAPVLPQTSNRPAQPPVESDNQPGVSDNQSAADSPATSRPDRNAPPEFRVGPGDSLIINVWKEPEVSGNVTVRGDCRIALNLIKDVEVCGMTLTQIQALLTDKLRKFIAAPDVTVTRKGVRRLTPTKPGPMFLDPPLPSPKPSARPAD